MTRHAFTLLEMTLALGIAATVMIGTVAAIGIGGGAFAMAARGHATSAAADGAARIATDVRQALAIKELDAAATTFTVPDRTGDGVPDTLRYAWGGASGDPITVSLNGSAPEAVIDAVADADFTYLVATVAGVDRFVGPDPAPTDELAFERADDEATADVHTLEQTQAIAAIVEPTLGEGDGLVVTRAVVHLAGAGAGAPDVVVQLRAVTGSGTPDATVLAEAVVPQGELWPTPTEVEVDLTSTATFEEGDHVAIVVWQQGGASAGTVPTEPSPQFLSDGWVSIGQPGAWGVYGAIDMPVRVYAKAAGD